MSDAAQGRLSKRLRRILLLLPYAIRHPGVTVDELSRKFGVKRRDLIDDLNLVFLCGLPGYGPGDLIDATIEDDRVYVRMADYFGGPLRLTPAEALALYAGGQAIVSLPETREADSLRRALEKLKRALGEQHAQQGASGIRVEIEPTPSSHLQLLQKALAQHKQVRLDYFSASRGELTSRTVDPWGMIAALGRWYLVAYDHLSRDERMFRADRIRQVQLTDAEARQPQDFDPDRYRGAFVERPADGTVRLEVSPAAARWFLDYYPVRRSSVLHDGWQEVELTAASTRWAALLVLRLGEDARAVRPASVIEAARSLAAEIAARHQGALGGHPR